MALVAQWAAPAVGAPCAQAALGVERAAFGTIGGRDRAITTVLRLLCGSFLRPRHSQERESVRPGCECSVFCRDFFGIHSISFKIDAVPVDKCRPSSVAADRFGCVTRGALTRTALEVHFPAGPAPGIRQLALGTFFPTPRWDAVRARTCSWIDKTAIFAVVHTSKALVAHGSPKRVWACDAMAFGLV